MPPNPRNRGRADFARQVARVRTEAAKAGCMSVALSEAAAATDNPGVAAMLKDLAAQGREGRVEMERTGEDA